MADGPIELLSRARAGETEALGELCALYRNYLRMIVRTGLGVAAAACRSKTCRPGALS
jgi:RNA polymerase sigma-70 factor (ECF subfamily)